MKLKNHQEKRIDELLDRGLKKSVILIEAAPGYGKTEVVRNFLKKRSINHAWLRLRQLDNWLFLNWKQLIKCLTSIMPAQKKFLQLEAPTTAGQIAELIEAIEQSDNGKKVLVIDDFSILQAKDVRFLYESLIEADFSSLCLIIISDHKTNLSTICRQSDVDFLLLSEKELYFTKQETKRFFEDNHRPLSLEQLETITEKWRGWPLPLFMLVKDTQALDQALKKSVKPVQELFNDQFFQNYSKKIRRTLIQFSLLDKIPKELLNVLQLQKSERDTIKRNPFISYVIESNTLVFHKAYFDFLREHQTALLEEERQILVKSSAEIFLKRAQLEDSLPLFLQCEDYDQVVAISWTMLSLLSDYSRIQFLYHHMKQIPIKYFAEHSEAELLRIYLLFSLNEIKEAEAALSRLISKIERMSTPDTEILGEAHFLLTQTALITGASDFLKHLKAASDYLPNGRRYLGESISVMIRAPWVRIPRLFEGENNQIEQTKILFKKVNPYFKKIYHEKNVKIDTFYEAEIAFYKYDLRAAKIKFLELLHNAKIEELHEAHLLIRHYLVRIALLKGELSEAKKQLEASNQVIQKYKLYQYNGFQARLKSWIDLYLHRVEDVPTRIVNNRIDEFFKWEVTRNGVAQARCFIQLHRYADAIALLNYLEGANTPDEGHWMNRLYITIIRAIANSKLGERSAVISDMYEVYKMTYGNRIVTPFIEFGGDMRYLIHIIREDSSEYFDKEWLDYIYIKTNSLDRRMNQLRKHETKENGTIYLTSRRMEILKDMVEGLTIGEIAEKRGISVNTVKTHFNNIYNDLGAANRSDAIRIAISKGIV